MNDITLLSLLSQELHNCSQKNIFNSDKLRQSSVAIIFQVISDDLMNINQISRFCIQNSPQTPAPTETLLMFNKQPLSLLFLQRAYNQKDLHSGQICFPGGKLETNENDYEASIRETYEEAGIDLKSDKLQTLYLGRLPNNLFVRKIKQINIPLYVCAHVFVIITQRPIEINLNTDECNDYKWIPLSTFYINVENRIIRSDIKALGSKMNPLDYIPFYWKYFIGDISRENFNITTYHFDLDFNGLPLWGHKCYPQYSILVHDIRPQVLDNLYQSRFYLNYVEINQESSIGMYSIQNAIQGQEYDKKMYNIKYITIEIQKAFEKNYKQKRIQSIEYKNNLNKSRL